MPTLLLVDGSSYLYRAFHALPDPAMRVLRETPADVLRALADILRRHVQCVEIRGGF